MPAIAVVRNAPDLPVGSYRSAKLALPIERAACAHLGSGVRAVGHSAHHSRNLLERLLAVLGLVGLVAHLGDQPLGGEADDCADCQEQHRGPVLARWVCRPADEDEWRKEEDGHRHGDDAQLGAVAVQGRPEHGKQGHDRNPRVRPAGGAAQAGYGREEDQRRWNLSRFGERASHGYQPYQAGKHAQCDGGHVLDPDRPLSRSARQSPPAQPRRRTGRGSVACAPWARPRPAALWGRPSLVARQAIMQL